MKLIIRLSIFLSILSYKALSQHLHSCLPVCKSEMLMADFLRTLPKYDNDKNAATYLFYLRPNSCPRCEFQVFYLYKKVESKNKYILLKVSNKDAAEQYISANSHKGRFNYLIDTGKIINKTTTCADDAGVPVLIKLNSNSGKFHFIQPLLGLEIDDSLVQAFNDKATYIIDCKERKDNDAKEVKSNNFYSSEYKIRFPVEGYNFIKAQDKDKLLIIEFVSQKVLLVSKNGQILDSLKADKNELMHLMKKVDTGSVNYLLRLGIPKVIYVSADKEKDDYIISASIPKVIVSYDSVEKDDLIEYENEPVLIWKSKKNSLIRIKELNLFQSSTEIQTLSHNNFYNISDNSRAYAVVRGYPVIGIDESELEIPGNSPFIDSFYNNAPLYGITDTNGNLKGYLGELPRLFKKYQTGYFYSKPGISKTNDTLLIYSSISGDVMGYRVPKEISFDIVNKPLFHYNIFPDKMNLSKANANEYKSKLDVIRSYSENFLKERITDAILFHDTIYLLINTEEHLIFRKMDFRGNVLSERKFLISNKIIIDGSKLHVDANGYATYLGLEKRGKDYWICTIDLN